MMSRGKATLGALCLVLIVTGCQAAAPKTRKTLSEWSRGQQLGITGLNQRVEMVSDQDALHLVWVAAEGRTLHYTRLDRAGRVQVSTDVALAGAHPSSPRLSISADGSLRLMWTDNPRIPRALFFARLSSDGQLLGEPELLSQDGVRVSDYDLAHNPDDSLDIFWATEVPTDGGIYHLQVLADDRVGEANHLMVGNAAKPNLQVDRNGAIHLIWVEGATLQENNIYYAVYDRSTGDLEGEMRVGFYRSGTGLVAYPPVLGLDKSTAYVFWASEARGGGQAGEAQTFVTSFPVGEAAFNEAEPVEIPGTVKPAYHKTTGSLPYRQLASATAGWRTSYLYMPAVLGGQNDELGLFLVGQFSSRNRSSTEVAWAILADGAVRGYQLPTRSGGSARPAGMLDEGGNVHLVWLNAAGFGRYEAYYASTSEAVRANLDRLSVQDVASDALGALWNLAPALGFFPPVFLLWTILSFIWVVGFYIVKVEGGLERRASQVALAIAILLYLGSKLFLMPPTMLLYAPFVERFPANLQFIPVIGTLVFTTLIAVGAVAIYFRKREYRSMLAAYFIFVSTDALISLVIYIPGVIGP